MTKVTLESVILWMALSAFVGFITYLLCKRGKMGVSTAVALPVLAFYLAFVLTITVIERVPESSPQYKLELFWSYKKAFAGATQLLWENFWNVVLFVPFGFSGAVICKKHTLLVPLFGVLLSIGIEWSQLITHRGLFEFDDIVHNTLGTLLGVAALAMSRLLW